MSALARHVPTLLDSLSRWTVFTPFVGKIQQYKNFHLLTGDVASGVSPGGLFNVIARTKVRIYFPRPSERMRIKKHGWKTRMSTEAGRRVLMNRILKGRFVYSH